MNPFKSSDPEKRLQLDLDRVSTGRTKVAERLAAAQSAVAEHRMAAQRLARAGADDGALDVTEAQLRSAQDRVATLTAALDEIETQIATLQEALAQLADRKLRAETATQIERLAGDFWRARA